jgi:hypothetical protein
MGFLGLTLGFPLYGMQNGIYPLGIHFLESGPVQVEVFPVVTHELTLMHYPYDTSLHVSKAHGTVSTERRRRRNTSLCCGVFFRKNIVWAATTIQ